jgi:hypothetical protein
MLLDRQAAQIGKFLVALVDQKQGLLTITHENPGAMCQFMMSHRTLPIYIEAGTPGRVMVCASNKAALRRRPRLQKKRSD